MLTLRRETRGEERGDRICEQGCNRETYERSGNRKEIAGIKSDVGSGRQRRGVRG
jgi:hypothetical protein